VEWDPVNCRSLFPSPHPAGPSGLWAQCLANWTCSSNTVPKSFSRFRTSRIRKVPRHFIYRYLLYLNQMCSTYRNIRNYVARNFINILY
jgi:hypothetical protein